MPDLRITLRSLRDDFGVSEGSQHLPTEELQKKHPVIKAFVERRSQNSIGTETTNLPVSPQVVYNLHSGRYRALTWHQGEEDVVWLLGFGWHESGSADDAYAYLKQLDHHGSLFPGKPDFLLLYKSREKRGVTDFAGVVAAAADVGPELLATAESDPGYPKERMVGDVLRVAVIVERDEDEGSQLVFLTYSVHFAMPPDQPGILPSQSDWTKVLVPAFLPEDAEVSDLQWSWTDDALIAVYEDVVEIGGA